MCLNAWCAGEPSRRVGIARALMQQPELLLADEPTSSLDPKTSLEIMALMADLARSSQVPVIVNIHNVPLARRHEIHRPLFSAGCLMQGTS